MKYVIDIPDNVKKIVYFHLGNANAVWTTTNVLDDLEQLNSDYINEHFGSLQDEAYQRGYDKGYADKTNNIEVCNKIAKDIQDECYQRGFEDGKAVHDKGCEGCKYKGTIGMPPCIHCCNNFPNAWKKQDDKPIIGEVVERYLNGKRDGVGMFLGEDGDYWNCLFWTGAIFDTFAYPSNQFKRTGNVCDITKILEEMQT